jgi:hypothetical protein
VAVGVPLTATHTAPPVLRPQPRRTSRYNRDRSPALVARLSHNESSFSIILRYCLLCDAGVAGSAPAHTLPSPVVLASGTQIFPLALEVKSCFTKKKKEVWHKNCLSATASLIPYGAATCVTGTDGP